MILEFRKIKKENIFNEDFNEFNTNNTIDFSEKSVSVLYAPNGVGKSSFTKTLGRFGEFELNYNNVIYNEQNCNLFHVINDQNSRNIIKGTAEDFL